MKAISRKRLEQMKQAIEDHINGFVFRVGGVMLPDETMQRLLRLGILEDEHSLNLLFNSYAYGLFSAAFGEQADYLSLQQFIDQIRTTPPKLGPVERAALEHVRETSYMHIKRLGEVMTLQTERIVMQANKSYQRKNAMKLKEELIEGIAKRKTIRQVALAMKASTKVYVKDFQLTAKTELNNAYQSGRAQEIIKRNKGKDPHVFKNPRKDACEHCKRLYLEDDGKTPKVFLMSELIANGNNIGRHKGEWKPIIESTHPDCMCKLYELPAGFGFDTEGRMRFTGFKKSSLFDEVVQRHRAA